MFQGRHWPTVFLFLALQDMMTLQVFTIDGYYEGIETIECDYPVSQMTIFSYTFLYFYGVERRRKYRLGIVC